MSDINVIFRSLPKSTIRIAYFLAVEGGRTRGMYNEKYRKLAKISNHEFDHGCSTLNKKNISYTMGWYPTFQVIGSDYRIAVIKHMLDNDAAFYNILEKVFETNDDTLTFMSIIRYVLTGKDKPSSKRVTDNMASMFMSYYNAPWIGRALEFFDDANLCSYIDNLIFQKSVEGELIDREVLYRICECSGRREGTVETVEGLKALYMYTAYGEYILKEVPLTHSPWAITTAAIKATLDGRYEDAVKLFETALKLLNRNSRLKNMYVDIFPMYYYTMALYHLNNEATDTKFAQILKKKDVDQYLSVVPSRFLIRTYLNGQQPPKDYSLPKMSTALYGDGQAVNVQYFARLFDKYFNTDQIKGNIGRPVYAIMRHELRDYLELDDKECDALTKSFGDKPALTSIYRKKDWELLIDEVMKVANIQAESVTNAPATPTTRIIYVLGHDNRFEPKYQTVLKSGAWSKPKNVAIDKFLKGEIEMMDDIDRQIADRMRPVHYAYSDTNNPANILPLLIGSDRVFAQKGYNDIEKITVTQEQPYIKVEKATNRKGFTVSSNVSKESLRQAVNGYVTVRTSPYVYTIIPLDEAQRRIYEKLLSSPYFPAEAKQQLQKFLTHLDNVIEVKSSLIAESEIPTVLSDGRLALKIEPNAGMMYTVSIYAKPLEGASAYCMPATGRPVVYIDHDGQSVRVKRDLKAENDNLKEIIDVIATDDFAGGDADNVLTLEAEQLLSLLDHVRHNPDKVSAEWPEGKGVVLHTPLSQGTWHVGIKSKNGWFDIEGEVKIDDGKVIKMSELLDIIADQKGRYIRLGDDDFIEIDKKLRRQLERIEALAVKSRGHTQISAFNAPLLDESVLDGAIKIEYDDTLVKMQQRIAESGEYAPRTPKTLNATLRPYQTDGFQWMARLAQWGAGACLADDMGLGKTVQTIAFLLLKAKEGPALIVAPASVVPNWQNELERFAPSLHVTVLNKADDRAKAVKDASKADVILCTYGLLSNQEESVIKKKWTTVCLDEAHTIKNRETKMSKAAMMLQAKYRIALTGTPLQNHLGELWNLFNFINPGLLGSVESFRQKYVNPILQSGDKDRRRALQRIIKPFMLRRTKAEVIDELPDKTDIMLPVELSESEMALYEAIRVKAVEALAEAKNLDVNTLAEITKLRRAACAPELIDSDWSGASSKVQAFLDLVHDFKGENNRMLVFSQFTSFLTIVRKALDEAGEKYLYLDGSTPMQQREKLVEEFQQGECPIFLISLKAGGLGLNLTAANYVVHLDPWWNPAIEQQATDRTYRIGQNRNVTVYHLIARNTIEEKIRRLHQTKRDLADSLLEGTDMASKLTVKDVLEMVNGE